ncbi:hypothetical protein ABZT34_07090 [Streptomyces sp. NPDC005329]|uniref:hypothetical protein n=1 Tax=Streptomyces sp. NPDC005329 TaxID=3157034 RepID=UPI0033A4170B
MKRDPEVRGALSGARTIDPRHFFPTVEAAVAAFHLRTGAEWTSDPDAATPPPAAAQDDT